ncbi:MAG: hypothetical protein KAR19_03630 [Bacteroidales bacterium]|nr:hypothetical protein [Bacteroidales bacterium]
MNQTISAQAIERLQRHSLQVVHRTLSQENILKAVCSEFMISKFIIHSGSSADQAVIPRSVVFLFAMLLDGYTLKSTGAEFGGKDHSTVVHGLKSVAREYDINRQFRKKVDRIRIQFNISPESFDLHINRWRRK